MKLKLALSLLLAATSAHALPTININDSRFDVQWLIDNGCALDTNPTLITFGSWSYCFTLSIDQTGQSIFTAEVDYRSEINTFSGLALWGTQVYDWSDCYADGDSAYRLISWALNSEGDGAIVLHVAHAIPTSAPDTGSTLLLLAFALGVIFYNRK